MNINAKTIKAGVLFQNRSAGTALNDVSIHRKGEVAELRAN
jgi:hypothetical protein